jgi:hypothetical protein
VMINEEHDTPLHRAFTTRLLPVLYAKGFRYLAAETLDERIRKLIRAVIQPIIPAFTVRIRFSAKCSERLATRF